MSLSSQEVDVETLNWVRATRYMKRLARMSLVLESSGKVSRTTRILDEVGVLVLKREQKLKESERSWK